MMGKTHKIGGAIVGFVIINALAIVSLVDINFIFVVIPFILANIIGAFICDIDSIKSTVSRKLLIIAVPIFLLQKILNFILRKSKSTFAKNIRKTVNHRGFAHWPILYITGIVIIFIVSLITKRYEVNNVDIESMSSLTLYVYNVLRSIILAFLYGICTGALSHILLDSFNPTGVPLFAPFSFKRKSFMNIQTGLDSKAEIKFRRFLKFILTLLIILFFAIILYKLGLLTN